MDFDRRETSEELSRALQALNSPRSPRSFVAHQNREAFPEQGFSRTFKELIGTCKDSRTISLKTLRNSPGLLILRVWHTYGIWVGACVYFIISANLMLAWYIDWYRTSMTCSGDERCIQSQLLDFPLAPFFAIFCRSWLMVCIMGDLLRFCFILARDVWEDDAFVSYRRVCCCDFQLDEEDQRTSLRAAGGGWSKRSTAGCCGIVDVLLQLSIYVALDILPLVRFMIVYFSTGPGQLGQAVVAASVSLAAGSCAHAFVFYLAMWTTDIVTKCQAFSAACRGVARLQPCEYPGSSLQNFQWAGGFGDRMLDNLESARCISVVEDIPDGPPDFVSPLSSEAGSAVCKSQAAPLDGTLTDPSIARFPNIRMPLQMEASSSSSTALPVFRPKPDLTIQFSPSWGSYLVTCVDGELSKDYLVKDRFDKDIPLLKDRSFVPQKDQFPLEIWRQVKREEQESPADKRNICVFFCKGWYPAKAYGQKCLPHLLCIGAIALGFQVKNWGLVLAGAVVAVFLVFVWLLQDCCCAREQPYFATAAGSWELWALQAWGEHHCGLRYDVQRSRRITFGVVVLLQGMLFATLYQWMGMLVCFSVVLLVCLRHCMVYRERPWGWLVGMMIGLGHALLAVVLNFIWLDARWGVTTLVLALFHQLGLSRHNPRGFNVARFTALLLNGVLVVVVGVVVLTLATLGVNSDYSAFCIEGTSGCKYYEVPMFVTNSSSPVECGQNYPYGSRGQKALSISDFALFSSLAYESEEGLVRGLKRYHPGWRLTFSRRAGIGDPEASLDWTTYFEFEDAENSTSIIAVRGTSTMLDVLDDMNIWLPAAIMKVFSIVGPKLTDAVAEAIARVSTLFYSDGLQKQYFQQLLNYVQKRQAQFPNRRLYITGHSLGGGLAKLVAANVSIPAVTFMAPGLESTSYLVYRKNKIQELHNVALTLMPDNDVVSRVDTQSGATVKTKCEGNMLHCHLLSPTICNILQECGSGRAPEEGTLYLPCGMCPDMPCG